MGRFNRNLWISLLLGTALTLAAEVGPALSASDSSAERPVADYEWALRRPDGSPASLKDFKGRVTFLNHWATWCMPCVREMPSIQALYDSLKGEGIAFVLVSDERAKKVAAFVKERGFTVPVYVSAERTPPAYQTPGIPATFILGKDGRIWLKHVGGAKWDADSSRSFLRALAKRRFP